MTRETRPGFSAYASVIRLRKRARMMQPPRQIVAIAYETITDARGHLPLLAPMSEVAGSEHGGRDPASA